jgi:hypothetical protein
VTGGEQYMHDEHVACSELVYCVLQGAKVVAAQLDVEDAFKPGDTNLLPDVPTQLSSSSRRSRRSSKSSSSISMLDLSNARVLRLGRQQLSPPSRSPSNDNRVLWLDVQSHVDALPWLQAEESLTIVRDVANVRWPASGWA